MAGRGGQAGRGGEEGGEEPGQPVHRPQQNGGEEEGEQQGGLPAQLQVGGQGHCGGHVCLVGIRVGLDPGSLPGGPGQEPPHPGSELGRADHTDLVRRVSHPNVKERRDDNLMDFLCCSGVTVGVGELVAVAVLGTHGGFKAKKGQFKGFKKW